MTISLATDQLDMHSAVISLWPIVYRFGNALFLGGDLLLDSLQAFNWGGHVNYARHGNSQ